MKDYAKIDSLIAVYFGDYNKNEKAFRIYEEVASNPKLSELYRFYHIND